METINKGTIVVTRDGEIIVFPNGNDGEKGEYRKFVDNKRNWKRVVFMFATPSDLAHSLTEGSDDSEKIRELQSYAERNCVSWEIERILKR